MQTRCQTCMGHGAIPTGGPTMTSAVSMSWSTCPECDGTGVHVDCPECCDSGVNVYDIDFDPANPAPCEHCQPVAA